MLTSYIKAAMRRAHYEILSDGGSFYGEIDGLAGVYANAETLEACRDELEEVLEEWILLRVSRQLDLPLSTSITGYTAPSQSGIGSTMQGGCRDSPCRWANRHLHAARAPSGYGAGDH